MSDTTLHRAHTILIHQQCICLDTSTFKMCAPIQTLASTGNTATNCFTWKPEHSHLFTLMRKAHYTLIYCHTSDMLYYASAAAQLAQSCPEEIAFLAQYCEDADVPRLLVFDILEANVTATTCAARGNLLRKFAECLPTPLSVLQWAGELQPLKTFVCTLPHNVECIWQLTDTALKVVEHAK